MMFNLAVFLLIILYVSVCAVVVGSWAFKTIDEDTAGIMDNIDDDEFKARKEKKRLLNKKLSKMGRTANQVKKWKAKMKEQGIDIRNIRWT